MQPRRPAFRPSALRRRAEGRDETVTPPSPSPAGVPLLWALLAALGVAAALLARALDAAVGPGAWP